MISDPQDVNSLKGTNPGLNCRVEAFNQAKASADKAEYTSKSYFGKDRQKQITHMLEEPLKKLDQLPIDLSMQLNTKYIDSFGQGTES